MVLRPLALVVVVACLAGHSACSSSSGGGSSGSSSGGSGQVSIPCTGTYTFHLAKLDALSAGTGCSNSATAFSLGVPKQGCDPTNPSCPADFPVETLTAAGSAAAMGNGGTCGQLGTCGASCSSASSLTIDCQGPTISATVDGSGNIAGTLTYPQCNCIWDLTGQRQ